MPIGDCDPEEYLLKSELQELSKVFRTHDKDGSGMVTSSELQPMFASIGMAMKPYQIDAIVREYDLDNSGEIDLEEFLVMMIKLMGRRVRISCINYHEYLTEEMIDMYDKAFRNADDSGEGRLDLDEVRAMLKNMGFSMDKKSVEELFREVDTDRSGFIEFDEYCAMMVKLTGVRKRINAREYIAKEDILAYRQAFQKFDSSGDGTISSKELDALLRKMGLVLRFDQVEALMTKYDANQSGELDFTEFLSIMVDLKKLRRQRKINPATTTAKELRAEGFTAAEVKGSGFPAKLMRQDGFRAQEMVDVFKTVDLRHSGYTAREMRQTDAGISKLKRVGYSSTSLRNAGYSSRSIAAINKRLNRSNEEVPHYSQRRAQSAPDMPGQMTPRVRHFADDVLIGLNTKGLFKSKVKEMVSQGKTLKAFAIRASAVGGDRPNTAPEKGSRESRLSRVDTFTDQLRAQLGVEQQISAVGLGETVKVKAPAVKKPK